MSNDESPTTAIEWLSLPDVAEALGETISRVHRLLDESALIASRRGGTRQVPAAFIIDGEVLGSLRGTAIVLHDAGFSDDETIDWLFAPEASLGHAPIESLRAGRKSEVRRIARTLA